MNIKGLSLLSAAALFALSGCGGGGSGASASGDANQASFAGPAASAMAPGSHGDTALQAAVDAAMRRAKASQAAASYGQVTEPVTEVQRRSANGDWVFGGAYFPIPAHVTGASPVNALFVAQRLAAGWKVTLEDEDDFHEVLQAASPEVTSDDERRVFASRSAALKAAVEQVTPSAAQNIGLSLPYRKNDANWGMWGVHGDGGNTRPFNSIDFMAGDGRVLTSRAGVAYKFCTNGRWPFIKVVHDNGYTTGYYHLRNQASINNGQKVKEGEFLGNIGVELPCGGSANGDHVHWSLWRGDSNGRAEVVNGKLIGGWAWTEGAQAYTGYAERNGKRIYYNDRGLVNYGAGGSTATATAAESP